MAHTVPIIPMSSPDTRKEIDNLPIIFKSCILWKKDRRRGWKQDFDREEVTE